MDVFYGLVYRGLLWMYLTVLLRPMTGIVLTQCGSWEVFMLYMEVHIYTLACFTSYLGVHILLSKDAKYF